MELLGFLRGGWDNAFVWCHHCNENRRSVWNTHDFDWHHELRDYKQFAGENLLLLQKLIQEDAPKKFLDKFRHDFGFNNVSSLFNLLYSPLQIPAYAHHSLLGYLGQHFKCLPSFLTKKQLGLLENLLVVYPTVNNFETFSSLALKGLTAHQVNGREKEEKKIDEENNV